MERLEPALSPMAPPTVSTPGTVSIRAAASSAAAVVSAKELPSGIVSVTIICSISISGRNVKPLAITAAPLAMADYRTQQLDLLADGVRSALDMDAVYAAMGLHNPRGGKK